MDVVAKRKIQHLNLCRCGNFQVHTNHLRLYKCETLVHLKLFRVIFDDAELVLFPCLKTMHLQYVSYPNKAAFEELVSRCPILEELKIYFNDDDKKGFQVYSQSLRRLTLVRQSFKALPGLVIDAPLLCSLSISAFSAESIIINNLESNAKLCIYLYFVSEIFDESRRSNIRNFLSGISRVGDMTTNAETLERIIQYSKVEPLPQFGFMSCLEANLYSSDLKCLPTFLESCPNLKSLILDWAADDIENKGMSQMSFSYVPKCLQSSLEFIYIVVPITEYVAVMKIIRYFL